MGNLSERLASLSPEQREQVLRKLQQKKAKAAKAKAQTIPIQQNEENEYLLAPAQQLLWLADQLMPDTPIYNVPMAFRVLGDLQVDALETAVSTIVARHEALRLVFTSHDGTPVQRVMPEMPNVWSLIDYTNLDDAKRDEHLVACVDEEAKRPFNLETGPLIRATVVKFAADDHLLMLTLHHIISDGWSLEILLRELSTFYQQIIAEKPIESSELTIQYKDYAAWEHNRHVDGSLNADMAYWEERFADALPVLEMPIDKPRPVVQTHRGGLASFTFEATLLEQLNQLSRTQNVSLFMTLLSAYTILLARYSQQNDIVIGSATANRNQVALESLIGYFVNMVPIRISLPPQVTFNELLQQVRRDTLDAFAHEALSFNHVAEKFVERSQVGRSPIFQTSFVLQSGPIQLEIPDLETTLIPQHSGTTKFELSMDVWEENGCLSGIIEYDKDLFDPATIEQMIDNYQSLLKGIVATPDVPFETLPLLSEAQRTLLLHKWNDTAVALPETPLMHRLFEAQVDKTPAAVALIADDWQLSYTELNQRANQLAHYLRGVGLQPEQFVGLHLDRSVDMLVAMLATMKAGGVYLPLDPSYPEERLVYMLQDTNTSILLTHEALANRLPIEMKSTICLDSEWAQISTASSDNLDDVITPQNLVYVIYTSGSTGRPKGVMIPHVALVNHAQAIATQYDLNEEDNVLQFAALSFDVAAEELYPTWLSGATVVLRPESVLTSFEEFHNFVDTRQITVVNLPAAYWQEWVHELSRTQTAVPASIRLVVTGSEKVSAEKLNRWLQIAPEHVRWMNAYGPTEATITSTIYEPAHDVETVGTAVPIGSPIANLQAYVLDKNLQPVPVGVPGELHLGGVGLARGYLNQPDRTEMSFIQNPFSEMTGDRLYKTGDLVRYLPDGNIDFLGRVDHQVKIRGFRIELGEIEAVLGTQEGVAECVVEVRDDPQGNGRLVAFIVPDGESVDDVKIRTALQAQLPEYMVPTDYVSMTQLPLTPSGKIDRKVLPTPDFTAQKSKEFVPPRTSLETQLVTIWEDLLNVKPIGVTDNYFELGGQSLLAMRLFAQINEITGQKLPLTTLFESPTIEQLAVALENKMAGIQVETQSANNYKPWVIPIQPNGRKRPFFHMGGSALLYNLARHLGEDQPLFGILEQDLDGDHPLYITVEDIVPHCIEGIRSVQPNGPYILGGLCFGAVVSLEVARALRAQGETVDLVVMIDSYAPGAMALSVSAPVNGDSKGKRLLQRGPVDLFYTLKHKAWRKSWKYLHQFYLKIDRPMPYRFRDIEEANTIANDRYVANEYDGDVILFQVEELDGRAVLDENMMGWGEYIHGNKELYQAPGGHLSVYDEPHVQVLGEQIRECIDRLK